MLEFRILGPLEVWDGRDLVDLGTPQERAVLAVLVIRAGQVVSRDRLIDEVWGDDAPRRAANAIQVHISHLRKAVGPSTIETKKPGYVLRLGRNELDLSQFEELFEQAAAAYRDGDREQCADLVARALELWRGPALADFADEPFARSAATRIDELRLTAYELSIDAQLALGRNDLAIGRLEELIAEEPTRERFGEQLMLALYRSGRQSDALAAYQDARNYLVDRVGIEPGRALRELERAVLPQDEALSLPDPAADDVSERATVAADADLDLVPDRAIVVAGDSVESVDRLISVSEPLARQPRRELIVACLVRDGAGLAQTMSALEERRTQLEQRGVATRVTTFTSEAAGSDIVRLTTLPDGDLVLVEGPAELAEGGLGPDLREILTRAPCDVGVVWPRSEAVAVGPAADVFVPFGGDEHEFTAAEIASWIVRTNGAEVWPLGRSADAGDRGRDASRLLGNVALALQRVTKVVPKPLLIEPGADAVLEAAREAGLLVLGFPDDWSRRGLGSVRAVLAREARPPVLAVRAGSRPSGVVPIELLTRFSWTLSGSRV